MRYEEFIYGHDRNLLNYSPEDAWKRLYEILNDKVMGFNPYLVGDEELEKCAMRGYWRDFPALTQMVVFTFVDLRMIKKQHTFDALFYRVGNNMEEYYFPLSTFVWGISYRPTFKNERSQIGKKRITNFRQVEDMIGKSFFVSHALCGSWMFENAKLAYRMVQLYGTVTKKAKIIREAMIASKIAMLKELLDHPYHPAYLNCPRNLINYEPIVLEKMEEIRRFPSQFK